MKPLVSSSQSETEEIAARIGHQLRGGEVIELVSDLGGGKTTFVRGLVRGARSEDHVSSPTFTLSKVYKTPDFEIHHFDFYRLGDAGILGHELHDLAQDRQAVIVVEWADVVQHVLPEERLSIKLSATGENSRKVDIGYPTNLKYLVDEL